MVSAGVPEWIFAVADARIFTAESFSFSFPLISRTSSFWLVEPVSQVFTSFPFRSTVTRSVSAMISSSLWVT